MDSVEESGEAQSVELEEAELLLNTSSHSGVLSGKFLEGAAAWSMGLVPNQGASGAKAWGGKVYVFPIASTAYGSDGCPLNRFDTIRLKLKTGTATGNYKISLLCWYCFGYLLEAGGVPQYHS